jgi:hypothetical protein
VNFIKQVNGTTTASLAGGVFTLSSTWATSGNAFKFVSPNYYGTSSNGFIALPTTMSGDFSITAQVTVTTQIKNNNACGIGLGMTTGFLPTDVYAYMLMRNSGTASSPTGSTNAYYVNGVGTISSGGQPILTTTNGTPYQLTFSRVGTNVTFSVGPVAGAPTTQTIAATLLTNGTTVYGTGPVYPAISFDNVAATVTKLQITDATGTVVYDSDTGTLVPLP